MADGSLIMQPYNVHAINRRLKTQTRRVMNPQPIGVPSHMSKINCHSMEKPGEWGFFTEEADHLCRYGPPGRILWVKEPWRVYRAPTQGEQELYFGAPRLLIQYQDDPQQSEWKFCDEATMLRYAHVSGWQNPRFMPRWASRLSLKVTEIKAQLLGAMTVQEIYAEGIRSSYGEQMMAFGELLGTEILKGRESHLWDNKPTVENWIWFWNLINEARGHSYTPNTWVWAVKFQIHRENKS